MTSTERPQIVSPRPRWADVSRIDVDLDHSTMIAHRWTSPTVPTLAAGGDSQEGTVLVDLCRDDVVTVSDTGVSVATGPVEVFLGGLDATLSIPEARLLRQALGEILDRYDRAERSQGFQTRNLG